MKFDLQLLHMRSVSIYMDCKSVMDVAVKRINENVGVKRMLLCLHTSVGNK
jgi:hypothetical protein